MEEYCEGLEKQHLKEFSEFYTFFFYQTYFLITLTYTEQAYLCTKRHVLRVILRVCNSQFKFVYFSCNRLVLNCYP